MPSANRMGARSVAVSRKPTRPSGRAAQRVLPAPVRLPVRPVIVRSRPTRQSSRRGGLILAAIVLSAAAAGVGYWRITAPRTPVDVTRPVQEPTLAGVAKPETPTPAQSMNTTPAPVAARMPERKAEGPAAPIQAAPVVAALEKLAPEPIPLPAPVTTAEKVAAAIPAPPPVEPKAPLRPVTRTQGKLDAQQLARHVDARIDEALRKEGLPASPSASDAEFIRRLWLDLHGVIPPADRVAAFLAAASPDKRAQLIDEALADPRYGRNMGERWKVVLAAPWTPETDKVPVHLLTDWLADRFHKNQPWDQLARDMLTATGKPEENGAVLIYLKNVSNYTKALRPHDATDTANRLWPALMGVDIKCAQCHDHKLAPVKQTDYWGMIAFLGKLQNNRPDAAEPGLVETGARPVYPQVMLNDLLAYNFDPRTIKPKYLFAAPPPLPAQGSYRPTLAAWVTAPQNPYFARNMVNRTWALLFGRGLSEALANYPADFAPSHPELAKELTEQFVAAGFDVKHLIRAICNSQAYQRTSQPVEGNKDDGVFLSHMAMKVLNPVQLYDTLTDLLGEPAYKPKVMGGITTPDVRQAFLLFFESEDDASPTAYGRGIPQVLRLMNSPEFNKGREELLAKLAPAGQPADKVLDRMFLTLLARYPSAGERTLFKNHLSKAGSDPRKAYAQVLWALLNSSEFTVNH